MKLCTYRYCGIKACGELYQTKVASNIGEIWFDETGRHIVRVPQYNYDNFFIVAAVLSSSF